MSWCYPHCWFIIWVIAKYAKLVRNYLVFSIIISMGEKSNMVRQILYNSLEHLPLLLYVEELREANTFNTDV